MNRYARPTPAARRAPAAANESLDKLKRVLEYELRRGCDDGAVIGGLDRFLSLARSDKTIASLLTNVPKLEAGYAGAGRAAREAYLRTILAAKPSKAKAGSDKSDAKAAGATGKAVAPPSVPASDDPLDAPVTVIKGVKGALQIKLAKLDVRTVRDMLYLFPNRHNDFASVRPVSDLVVGEEQTAVVSIWSATKTRLGRRDGTQAVVGDETGTMRVVWFNQPYLAEQLRTNDRIVLAGKVSAFNGMKGMESPEWERLTEGDEGTHTGRLVPVYPLTQGLSQRVLRRSVKDALDRFVAMLPEPLPDDIVKRHKLLELVDAMRQMHYPESAERYEEARRRIAFEELLCVQLAVLERRLAWQEGRASPLAAGDVLDVYRAALPFALTGAQERVLGEVMRDLETSRPMARLLQGDVGSGKTAVAGAALVIAVANGHQGALMAPTEILAEQHYRTLTKLLSGFRIEGRELRIELLAGSMRNAQKQAVAEAIASGEIDIAVGTHALIQERVSFARLGLTVVDEQHRFGVMQRAALRERASTTEAKTPHLLVMSATPIPRTLSLTFFGDLDVSVIDEMPPGRIPISTHWVAPEERATAYGFVRQQIDAGRQAFVVCPLIEESAAIETRSATQEYERLKQVFPDLRLGLLHGRLAASEKESTLNAFRRGELHMLVATTVIEVGIDIPNATVMAIEGADRFGLAQLHQLRGRVGRGGEQSYCLLLSDDPGAGARERLKLLESTTDGFALAEADLRLRGPGDIMGVRQSGLPEFQAADFSDIKLIEQARGEAMHLLQGDPGLVQREHAALAKAVAKMKRIVSGEVS